MLKSKATAMKKTIGFNILHLCLFEDEVLFMTFLLWYFVELDEYLVI